MPRVVLDTVVFVRALINPKSRSGRLLFEHADRLTIIVSKPTAQEFLEVIHRPELTTRYSRLGKIKLHQVIDLLSKAEAVEMGESLIASRDPQDNIFIATAIAGRAGYLVSEDKDLLVLKQINGTRILNTEEFIAILEGEER